MIPRIVIAGTQSGVGKTSITLGLVAALRRLGMRVQPFKVGPDYLDPTYLALASNRPCYNLDGWMTDRDYITSLFARACAGADIAVVEGVMGLFDGADPAGLAGSTAEIAHWLDAPVMLVASAHGASRSFAATAHGFTHFDQRIRIGGMIANQCGSARHAEGLLSSLHSASLPPLIGALTRNSLPPLPSRHLGLKSASPSLLSPAILDQLADQISAGIALEQVTETARSAPSAWPPTGKPQHGTPTRLRLGVARDEAFHFYYPDNLEALTAAGCEIIEFSPLRDQQLPEGLDVIYLGGGYPEEYAPTLAANTRMSQSIRQHAALGGGIYAECGGLMYMSQGIHTINGDSYPMLGLLPAWTRMTTARTALGYVTVTTNTHSPWGEPGTTLRGHKFHYSHLEHSPSWAPAYTIQLRRDRQTSPEGWQQGKLLASYVHLHFASNPHALQKFIQYYSK